ncbi:MAG: hypothetical protein R3264_06265, partial [Anaerolineae bacterium]|nr:hypothetical protein [Anaerolineae bacterium]
RPIMRQTDPGVEEAKPVNDVLKPLLYADIFDYPLTFNEIYRFLEFRTTRDELQNLLDQAVNNNEIIFLDGVYCLSDRAHLAARRQERWQAAQKLWPKAVHYGRWIAGLPFIRMVAVTGSLAVENPRDNADDIDFLIVTRPGRLWSCRAIIILLVRYARLRGVHLCPNYLLTENIIHFTDTNLFVAREMLQMIPLYGKDLYLTMRYLNDWVTDYLPQGKGLNLNRVNDDLSFLQRFVKWSSELVLGGVLGDWIERPLQTYQISKHTRLAEKYGAMDKVIFTAEQCKGHYDGHRNRIMTTYQGRLDKYNARFGPNGHVPPPI